MPPSNRKYTDDQWTQIDDLLSQGATVTEAANSTGVPRGSIYQRLRKTADPVPGGNRARGARNKQPSATATDDQLQSMLTKAAALPAIPAKLILHCNYCSKHFASTAPQVASEMVALANEYPWLRSALEDVHKYVSRAAVGTVLASWIGLPILHHAVSPDVFMWAAVLLNTEVPDPPAPARATHVHHEEPMDDVHVGDSPPPDNPFAGLDGDALMSMARQMGVEFMPADIESDQEEVIIDADATEEEEYVTVAAAEAPEEAQAVEADSDSGE